MRRFIAALLAFTLATAVHAQLSLTGVGPAGSGAPTQLFLNASTGSDAANNCQTVGSPCLTWAHLNTLTLPPGAVVNCTGSFGSGDAPAFTTSNAGINLTVQASGSCTINSGNSAACATATNLGGWRFLNITCTGGGTTTNTTDGILVQNTGSTNIAGPTITGVTVSGYGQNCIWLQAVNLGGFTGGTLGTGGVIGSAPTGAAGGGLTLHDCTGKVGVFTNGLTLSAGPNFTAPINAFQNINASNIIAFNLNGYAGAANWTGTGIWCESCTNVTFSNLNVHDTGLNSNSSSGPSCLLANFSINVTFQYGEAGNCFTGNGVDGDGLDFDGNVSLSSIHHFYVHDCSGYGLFGFQFQSGAWTGNSYHDNIVANCGLGQINIEATVGNSITGTNLVYNNTFIGPNAVNSSGTVSAQFYDNVFKCLTTAVTHCVNVPTASSQTFAGNDYNGFGDFNWNGTSYPNLAAWQAATGQEKIAGVPVGSNAEPMLVTYGYHATTNGYVPASLPQYQLQAASPMFGGGIDITAQFGLAISPTDFYGAARASSSKVIGAGQAMTWVSNTGTCSQGTTLLGRLSGPPNTAHQQQYNALWCGHVVDGNLASLDGFYKLATDTSTNALLNLVSTSFTLVPHGTIPFAADVGYTGDATTGYLDTTFIPLTAGGHTTQNNASFSLYVLNNRTTVQDGWWGFGAFYNVSTASTVLNPFTDFAGNAASYGVNSTFGALQPHANANAQGLYLGQRSAAGSMSLSKNGAVLDTVALASDGMPGVSYLIGGANTDVPPLNFSGDTIGYASFGAVPTNPVLFMFRINADAAAVGQNKF